MERIAPAHHLYIIIITITIVIILSSLPPTCYSPQWRWRVRVGMMRRGCSSSDTMSSTGAIVADVIERAFLFLLLFAVVRLRPTPLAYGQVDSFVATPMI